MARASDIQKAERLNLARELLRHKQPPEAASELARTCSISHRQAYRYLDLAQQLKGPVPVGDPKIAFTVKLSRTLVDRLREYATSTGLTLSEIVSRAVMVFMK
jgi:predicted DNA-binding transcriptional regulator YafY